MQQLTCCSRQRGWWAAEAIEDTQPYSYGNERKQFSKGKCFHIFVLFSRKIVGVGEKVKKEDNREKAENAAKQRRKFPVRPTPPGGCAGITLPNKRLFSDGNVREKSLEGKKATRETNMILIPKIKDCDLCISQQPHTSSLQKHIFMIRLLRISSYCRSGFKSSWICSLSLSPFSPNTF